MDDFDDGLDDILSEGDSFFEDPKVLAKKASPAKKSLKAADLFGLNTDNKPKEKEQKTEEDWLGLDSSKQIITQNVSKKEASPILPPKQITSKIETKKDEKISKDPLDIFGLNEGKNVKKEEETAKKKSSILNDILGETKKEEKSFTFDDILQSSSLKKKEITTILPTTSSNTEKNEFILSSSTRDSRRGRRGSNVNLDPLGLFDNTPKKETTTKNETPKKEEKLISKSKSSNFEIKSTENQIPASKSQPVIISKQNPEVPTWLDTPQKQIKSTPDDTVPDHVLQSLMTHQKISSSNMELQNASLSLQQQESQLMIAVQLKKYEENILEMQRKQQELLIKQDLQFNSLLERQFAKQQTMENNMRLQQERINHHIQLLLSQTGSTPDIEKTSGETKIKNDYIQSVFEENRKFYDDIIHSLKVKHQEEIFLLEESYKKQLSFLESSLQSTEQRLKSEIESINNFYVEKLEKLHQEKEVIIQQYEEKLKKINEINLTEIETIKENCKITISDVRNEYSQMIEDIKKNNQQHNDTILQANVITKKIDESVETLYGSTKIINEIENKFSKGNQLLADIKSESLAAKETEIKAMQLTLEKQRASNDTERAQLLTLIRTLETRVAEQTQSTREENWALQQACATLAARSAAIEREAEFVRRNLEREREQVKTLRESLLAEHESIILKLNEEKLQLAAEKSRLETSAKLNQTTFDSTKTKLEIDTALQVAKEATELTDKERENLFKQQTELEIIKRNLQDRETKLILKEQELSKLYKNAEQKYREGEQALTEAKSTELKYNERLKDIQKQLISLSTREKKLMEEKIVLSKERLTLHSAVKDNKKCGLCEADNYNSQTNLIEYSPHFTPSWGPDAEIMRLKYDLEQDNIVSKEQSIIDDTES